MWTTRLCVFMAFLLCAEAYWWEQRITNRHRRSAYRGDRAVVSKYAVAPVKLREGSNHGASVCGTGNNYIFYPGLPPNDTAIISGYLPFDGSWVCSTGTFNYFNAHGIFIRYYSNAERVGLSAGVHPFDPNTWQLHVSQYGNAHNMLVSICKWPSQQAVEYSTTVNTRNCLHSKTYSYAFPHVSGMVAGFSVSHDIVRFYWDRSVHVFRVPGADKWNVFSINCYHVNSCMHKAINTTTTAVVQTDASGAELNYTMCNNCTGYVDNIFSVSEGGRIPVDFGFNNWFYLTGSSSVINGLVRSMQPLRILCLTPVPKTTAEARLVDFNSSGVNCNGYSEQGPFDAVRFNLNFTDNVFTNGLSLLVLEFQLPDRDDTANATIYCTDDNGNSSIPFGYVNTIYYCYMNLSVENATTQYLGTLPPVVREIVLTTDGQFYLNGYMFGQFSPIARVFFSFATHDNAGFWTIAYANMTDVLVQLNGTNIQQLLYCESPYEVLCCDQMSFVLDDGFYATSTVEDMALPKTHVALPTFVTHSAVNFRMYSSTGAGEPDLLVISINASREEPGDSHCVKTSHFTATFIGDPTITGYYFKPSTSNCPFSLDKLNNYLTFDSICFYNVSVVGACVVAIRKAEAGTFGADLTNTAIYIKYKYGSKITGIKQTNLGVQDLSTVVYDTCTDYTIYGKTGRGVITKSNDTYVTGLYYVSPSGHLLAYKNVSTSDIFTVIPCQVSYQAAVVSNSIVGVLTSKENTSLGFNTVERMPQYYYHYTKDANSTECVNPVLTYGTVGVCSDGGYKVIDLNTSLSAIQPISTGNISIPLNFSVSVQTEFVEIANTPVSIDCKNYVCNGNNLCLQLLQQYTSACVNIERALQQSARLEGLELSQMLRFSDEEYQRGSNLYTDVSIFDNFNLSAVLQRTAGTGRTVIEDILFDKVVTSGLGTVDQDYKECLNGQAIRDLICAQYYNGIMVLPTVADANQITMYATSLASSMVGGAFTAPASGAFSSAVFARLNYVALQTDVLQENQKQLAASFNKAIDGITKAFESVNDAFSVTSQALSTISTTITKIQDAVNTQGTALHHLTVQLAQNFQAISASIEDIYNRLDKLEADAQVDRLITGRLAALNAYVAQVLTRYSFMRSNRQLADSKINECVKSQSSRYGFCGNGTHLFSVVNAAPNGFLFLHTVLVPTEWQQVQAWSGLCVDATEAYIVKDVTLSLFRSNDELYLTPRTMFEPRKPTMADFVRITSCVPSYYNITSDEVGTFFPDFVDVNKTIEDILNKLPNYTLPDLNLDVYNQTLLNLTDEINRLNGQAGQLNATIDELREWINYINDTRVDLQWLSRIERYVKWPWYVWLAIGLAVIFACAILVFCCLSTGCCGCCGCFTSFCGSCCASKRLPYYTEVEKVHLN
nr:spike protein [Bat coronavirus]